MALGNAFQFLQEDFAGAVRLLRAPAAGSVVKGVWRNRSRPSRPSSLDQKMELLALVARRFARGGECVSAAEVEGFRGRHQGPHGRRYNKELAGIAEKVLNSIQREVEEKEFKLSITRGGKEGKTQVNRFMRFAGRTRQGMQPARRSGNRNKRRNARSGPEDEDKVAGGKREDKEAKV